MPWPRLNAGDGTGAWGADHGPPIAAAADSERVYLGWTVSEAGRAVIAVKTDFTSDGKVQKLWGQRQAHDLGIIVTALAADGERVFVAQDGGPWGQKKDTKGKAGVVLWDAKPGKPINFPFGKRALVISEWNNDLKPPELKTGERLSISHPPIPRKRFWQRLRDHDFGPQELGLNLLGIAVAGDTLYASLYLENRIVAIDWRAGKTLAEHPVPKPAGLAVAQDGTIAVASERQLMRLNPRSGQLSTIVSTGLSSPWGVTLDDRGEVYVSDCGDSMQVKVFDLNGKPTGAGPTSTASGGATPTAMVSCSMRRWPSRRRRPSGNCTGGVGSTTTSPSGARAAGMCGECRWSDGCPTVRPSIPSPANRSPCSARSAIASST